MLFNSLTFVVFFVLVLTGYWTLRSWEARKNLLLAASYVFYGMWNPPFALLLFATTALDFHLGARIVAAATARTKRAWLVASLASNLSMLGFFKYGNLLLENTKWLLAHVGIHYQPPHLDLFLPIGISFYTFHSLSYTLDVYRGTTLPTRSLRDFTLAVSFFPQLVAGPIVRAADFLPQAAQPPRSASASTCATTSGFRTPRSASPTSGAAGTSRCRRSCATTSTFRSAAIAPAWCARRSIC